MSVGELAIAPGAQPCTLRHWEAERLLSPACSRNGARTYSPVDVRDAPLIHQLRQAGHRINPLRDLLPTLQTGDAWAEVLAGRGQQPHPIPCAAERHRCPPAVPECNTVSCYRRAKDEVASLQVRHLSRAHYGTRPSS